MFKNLPIKYKLLSSFFILILIFVITGINNILMVQQIHDLTSEMEQRAIIREEAYLFKFFVEVMNTNQSDLIVNEDNQAIIQYSKNADEAKKHLKFLSDVADTDEKKQIVQDLRIDFLKYSSYFRKVLGVHERRLELTHEELNHLFKKIDNDIDQIKNDVFKRTELIVDNSVKEYQNSQQELTSLIKKARYLFVVCLISGTLLGFFLAIWLSKKITQPIRELVAIAQNIAKGDLRGEVKINGKDEIGQLSLSIKKMVTSLHSLLKETTNVAQHISTTSQNLFKNTDQNQEASKYISDAIFEIASGSTTQAEQTNKIRDMFNKTVDEMRQGYKRIESTIANALQSSEVAKEGKDAIFQAIDHLNTVKGTVVFATDSIQKLGRRSKEIENIVSVITNFSKQINLLALNAAIEAKRAGEYGKGFSVVADEIRNLANNSNHSSQEIKSLIQDIQAETYLTVQTMESNLEEIEQQVEMIQKGGDVIETIVEHVNQTETDTKLTKQFYDELNDNVVQLLKTINEISDIAQESAASAQEIMAGTEEQLQSVSTINQKSKELSNLAQRLNSQVNKFTLN